MRDISVYIHIPFCVKKCLYCDFNSVSGKEKDFKEYKNSIIKEINSFNFEKNFIVKTIFIGGGTPSVLPSGFISEILNAVKTKFTVDEKAEISIEVNPGTINLNLLSEYKKSGINRISMGAQAFDDRLLKLLGRIHNKDDIFKSAELLKEAGFENINLDLMFALPSQSLSQWEETLKTAVSLSPSHLSVYSLIIEENTPFYNMYKKGDITLISDEEDRKMYYRAKEILEENGFYQYEISNFAKKGFECKHNITYWKRKEYLGFGAGAVSFFSEKRIQNNLDINEYIKGNYMGETEKITLKEAFGEFMFLRLRMNEGVLKKDFSDYFNVSFDDVFKEAVDINVKRGLLKDEDGRIWLTPKGQDLSNIVFCDFIVD